jgi:hypothetical protein
MKAVECPHWTRRRKKARRCLACRARILRTAVTAKSSRVYSREFHPRKLLRQPTYSQNWSRDHLHLHAGCTRGAAPQAMPSRRQSWVGERPGSPSIERSISAAPELPTPLAARLYLPETPFRKRLGSRPRSCWIGGHISGRHAIFRGPTEQSNHRHNIGIFARRATTILGIFSLATASGGVNGELTPDIKGTSPRTTFRIMHP